MNKCKLYKAPLTRWRVTISYMTACQTAERIGKRAINQKVADSIPQPCQMTLCPWARHFTLLASEGGECPCTYCKSLWIRPSAKWLNVNVSTKREKLHLNSRRCVQYLASFEAEVTSHGVACLDPGQLALLQLAARTQVKDNQQAVAL